MQRGTARKAVFLCILVLLASQVSVPDTRPLPEDTGAAHLWQLLLKLNTTARIMHTTAHPDDEDGGMMTYESRGKGASVLLFTVTRGEGGQNKFGSANPDELGILRTLELLQADKYYGVEQRFSHVVDFGFSKTAEETFNEWHGHDIALGDMVRAIRIFRPDVLTSRFSGTPRDGHGNHQAAGILTQEAFRAAGDPNRFPEQIKEGLLPWQPKKLYSDNVRGNEEYTLQLDTGTYSPFLGMSYAQFALEGLAHQTSQGSGGARIPPGHRYTYYKLLDSVLPQKPAGHEQDFLDGIDTSLAGLASRLGNEESKTGFLRPALQELQKDVDEAQRLFSMQDTSACAPPLIAGLGAVRALIGRVEKASLSGPAAAELLLALRTKETQFRDAVNESLGLYFDLSVDAAGGEQPQGPFPRMQQTFLIATPGQTFNVTAHIYNRGSMPIVPEMIRLETPPGWKVVGMGDFPRVDQPQIGPNESASRGFQVTVPPDAGYTEPYFTRKDPETETVYAISKPGLLTEPLPPYPLHAIATFGTAKVQGQGQIESVARIKFVDPLTGQSERPLAVGPALSVLLESPVVVIPSSGPSRSEIRVNVRNNLQSAVHASLHLEAPQGWKIEPASIPVELDHEGDVESYSFHVSAENVHEGTYKVTAVAEAGGHRYLEGFKLITGPDLDSFYAYHPATQNVQAVDVKLAPNLKVGYIMGAGDEIPSVLSSVGVNVTMITPEELQSGDLSRYGTIIVGIRAYDVRTDVREQNRRLLDYVNRGGTLIVQYNQSTGVFNQGHYTPFPATMSNQRVTVEEAPVDILAPQERIFSYPNKIDARDFNGWVQERGLYFMSQWDDQFQPLLACNDPGEPPQKGGMLLAHYGKGTYIYTGYAFFRQLPAGVPGAIRLFVNLLSAGH